MREEYYLIASSGHGLVGPFASTGEAEEWALGRAISLLGEDGVPMVVGPILPQGWWARIVEERKEKR